MELSDVYHRCSWCPWVVLRAQDQCLMGKNVSAGKEDGNTWSFSYSNHWKCFFPHIFQDCFPPHPSPLLCPNEAMGQQESNAKGCQQSQPESDPCPPPQFLPCRIDYHWLWESLYALGNVSKYKVIQTRDLYLLFHTHCLNHRSLKFHCQICLDTKELQECLLSSWG